MPAPRTPIEAGETTVLDIDDVLDRHWAVSKREAPNQQCTLAVQQLEAIMNKATEIFSSQPMLLELDSPLKICGDIHGQFHDLLRIFEYAGQPPVADYLFLGDYVDRGKRSIETVVLLLAYKIKYAENFFILRGNHETPSICRIYGFYDECKRRYTVSVWKQFCSLFDWLPICAVIGSRVICMHGGLSPQMLDQDEATIDQVNRISRPADIPDSGMMCDLLWADPHPHSDGFFVDNSDRGVSYFFGVDAIHRIFEKEDLDLVVRAHQVVEDGYQFFAGTRGVTVFSAPNYCGEFDNSAAIVNISEDLVCSFLVLKPTAEHV